MDPTKALTAADRPAVRNWLRLALVLWSFGVLAGFRLVWIYKSTPGATAAALVQWPTGSRIPGPSARPVLVMMLHPHCPCSRTSVDELTEILSRARGRLDAYILFVTPAGLPDHWAKTGTWERASQIPGVTVLIDRDAKEAIRFGAKTSGQTFLYRTNGSLAFSGGITVSRGHQGESVGRRTVLSILKDGSANQASARVFGCALNDPKPVSSVTTKEMEP